MSYYSTTLGGRPDNERLNLQMSDCDSTDLQGQCYEYLTVPIEPRKSNSWDVFHTSESGPCHQSSAFTPQSTKREYNNSPASLIPSPLESHDFFSSGPYFPHNNFPTDDGLWRDLFTMQPMINTATNDLFTGPCDRNCGYFDDDGFFPPSDSTLGDSNIDPSLESTINQMPPLRLVDSPDEPLQQPLQLFAGQPGFPKNHYQPFLEKSGMYTNQAISTFKVKDLGTYSQYDVASDELKYPFSSHPPQPIGRYVPSSILSQGEFASPSELLGYDGLESQSDPTSQIESLQNTAPLFGNLPLTTSHLFSSGAPHNSIKKSSTSTSTTIKNPCNRICSHCLGGSHNISQCPLKPCRHCSQMGHVSKDCEPRKTKNKAHRRVTTRNRRRIEILLNSGALFQGDQNSSWVEFADQETWN